MASFTTLSNLIYTLIIIFTVSTNMLTVATSRSLTHSKSDAKQYFDIVNEEKAKYESAFNKNRTKSFNTSNLPNLFYEYDNSPKVGDHLSIIFTDTDEIRLLPKSRPGQTKTWTTGVACGSSTVSGEIRRCVDSFESMLNFTSAVMGPHATALSTPPGQLQVYRVTGPAKTIGRQSTSCHPLKNLGLSFAVYTCHHLPDSQVQLLPLLGADGISRMAVVICHMHTSTWNPNAILLQMLQIHPGPAVCHFLATGDITWVVRD